MDMPFLFLVLLLVILGLIMMFSASYPSAYAYTGNSYSYLLKQSGYAAFGVFVMIGLSYFDYHHFHKLTYFVFAIAIIALLVVLVMPSRGVRRWISLGPVTIQASEIAKFAAVLFLAHWGSTHFKKMDTFLYGVLPAIIVLVVFSGLLILEPHYSGIVIMLLLVALMMFISGVKLRWFMIGGAVIALGVLALAVTDKLRGAATLPLGSAKSNGIP